jgi:glycosyltransferase involved in cell wall biosynthesis
LSSHSGPLVTIITPTYNRAGYLSDTIESVLGQGYPSLQYMVIDDGSTDNTLAVIEKYRDRITYLCHANMGEARTVNKGWQMARGEYVSVVNSDDPILPGLVRHAVEAFQEDPRLLVVYPDWKMIDQASNTVKNVRAPDYDYLNMVRWQKCLVGPGALIRKRAFSLEPGRDPAYHYVGDFEYWLRLGLHGPFARVPATLATHRVHPGAESGQGEAAWAEETMRVVDGYFARTDLPPHVRKLAGEARSNAAYNAARVCMASAPRLARG